MSACYESMTRLQIGDLRIRIWREEASLEAAVTASNADLVEWANGETMSVVLHGEQPHPLALFGALRKFQRISAIEIVDGDGFGAVEYISWP
jgi:hypothetical protein